MYIIPTKKGFFVYTKQDCPYCVKVKEVISNTTRGTTLAHQYVDCQKYLDTNREQFIEFAQELTHRKKITFPMVFLNGEFIGGCDDTIKYLAFNSEF
jgi:glutaredoxin 3